MMSRLIIHLISPVITILFLNIFGFKLRTGLLVVLFLSLGKEIYDFIFWRDSLFMCLWDMTLNIIGMFLGTIMIFFANAKPSKIH